MRILTPTFANNCINVVNTVKFLGINIDSSLNFQNHIDNLKIKLNKVCFALRILTQRVSFDTLRLLYTANFESLIRYGIMIWGSKSKAEEILKLQERLYT